MPHDSRRHSRHSDSRFVAHLLHRGDSACRRSVSAAEARRAEPRQSNQLLGAAARALRRPRRLGARRDRPAAQPLSAHQRRHTRPRHATGGEVSGHTVWALQTRPHHRTAKGTRDLSSIGTAGRRRRKRDLRDTKDRILELYRDEAEYLGRYAQAAMQLIDERLLISEELNAMLRLGQRDWDYVLGAAR